MERAINFLFLLCMECYKCFSCQPVSPSAIEIGFDTFVSDTLNKNVSDWAAEMKRKHPNFTYRIINANSVGNPHPKNYNVTGRAAIFTFLHIAYSY